MILKSPSLNAKTRYAPTPSGYLHIGNILNFFLTWYMAQKQDAQILLRIDDLDSLRSRDEYLIDIFETLEWLDLDYHIGPTGIDDFKQNFSQIKRIEYYRSEIQDINEDFFYWCNCSRAQITNRNGRNIYRGFCRSRNLKENFPETALRVKVPATEKDIFNTMGDFIVWRKENIPAYQLASLIDDYYYDINLIVRGEDLRESTYAQLFLEKVLGHQKLIESKIILHSLVKDEKDNKLSKSQGPHSIKETRLKYKESAKVYNELAKLFQIQNCVDIKNKYDLKLALDGLESTHIQIKTI